MDRLLNGKLGVFVHFYVLLSLLLLERVAEATENANGKGLYFSWAYVVAVVAVMAFEFVEALTKYRGTRYFSWRVLTKTLGLHLAFASPAVFLLLPEFGPPTGDLKTDFCAAFFTAYFFFHGPEKAQKMLKRSVARMNRSLNEQRRKDERKENGYGA